ncbi:ATP-binding cassette domain-containing protein [Streptomyces paludis]|uniref:ABC transporter ATP-binding protein n=1 Tax=Streptomyces paludis TaxID=2282738 RepID=A0A345HW87_9ACTN|nr:ABC transporter ATP-binding protein [Streptomyces paludis]AXG80961.1 ABC transporter ATP-binding protein [Streptomyces paludis]
MNFEGVGRRYGLRGPWVLRGVDLALPAGALVRVEGGNGSGKSTLLRLVAGVDTPSEGRVTGRRRTAYVPERFAVALPLTAAGYLVHLGRIHGLPSALAAARAVEWLDRFGAGEHARTTLSELSKGTSQKVAVAQALLAEPELLVLDEAWTGLDVPARAELDRAVAERVAEGGTVVYVDHDPRRLAGAADAVYAVTDGTLVRRTDDEVRAAAAGAGAGAGAGPGDSDRDGDGDGGGDPAALVRIVVSGPSGAAPPDGLPGAPRCEPGPDGSVLLTAPAIHSDALLRALLAARPAWHIREVREAGLAEDDTPARDTASASSGTTTEGFPR